MFDSCQTGVVEIPIFSRRTNDSEVLRRAQLIMERRSTNPGSGDRAERRDWLRCDGAQCTGPLILPDNTGL
jgi:hypothetical protein